MCFLEFRGFPLLCRFPFCMHGRDSCQDYYSEQTMSSLSEPRMNSITKFSSNVQPTLPTSLPRRAARRRGRTERGSPLANLKLLSRTPRVDQR